MEKILILAILFLAVTPAMARTSYVAKETTCAELDQVLKNEGQLILRNSIGEITYVKSITSCNAFQEAIPTYMPTKDKEKCYIGYQCIPEHDQP